MLDPRPIFFVLGLLLTTVAAAMLIPAAADALANNSDWQAFLGAAAFTGFIGVALVLTNRAGPVALNVRQMFVLTTLSWTAIAAFGAIPLAFADLDLTYTDAYFEAMSGITTTGSTVLTGLDTAPPGILLWRALLQWLGGIGIIVMAVAVLPLLQVGGMQLFRMESSETSDKALPRTAQIAAGITAIYLVLTGICALALLAAGMSGFDAATHAMTTIATGGFSTHDASVGFFRSPLIHWIIVAGMLLGSLPFLLYLDALRGRGGRLFRDTQVQTFFGIVVVTVAAIAVWRAATGGVGAEQAVRESAFNLISVITGTGYSTTDYGAWGQFAVTLLFLCMFIGGCAGSTSCGIKVFRFQVLYAAAKSQVSRLWHPHGVFLPQYNHKPLPDSVIGAVMNFVFLFAVAFVVLALALAALGLDFVTSVSSAATAISNVGPALGDIAGPAGNFSSFPDAAKWVLSLGMLLGRLELFTVLVLLAPGFWRG
ncbi:MAG: TrkH family potassium uptake protein [Proteobacteria bacterium]|nr:TrkH family potassium uptake protein [Pseudomonadota bacterium]